MTQVTLDDGDEKDAVKSASSKSAKSKDLPVSKQERDEAKEGAPVTESPEQAAAPPEEAPRMEAASVETPESPAPLPAMMIGPLTDIQSGGIRSGGSTYTNADFLNDAASMTAIDTGVATAPFDRRSTFTGAVIVHSTANDYGVGSTRTSRPHNFEPQQSATVYIAPGAS